MLPVDSKAPSAASETSGERPFPRRNRVPDALRGRIAVSGGAAPVLTVIELSQFATHKNTATHVPLVGMREDTIGYMNPQKEMMMDICHIAPGIVGASVLLRNPGPLDQGGVMCVDLASPDRKEPLSDGVKEQLGHAQSASGQGVNFHLKPSVRVASTYSVTRLCSVRLAGAAAGQHWAFSQAHRHLFAATEILTHDKFRMSFFDADTPRKGPLHSSPHKGGMAFACACIPWAGAVVAGRGPDSVSADPSDEECALVVFDVETGKELEGLKMMGHTAPAFSFGVDDIHRTVFSGQIAEGRPGPQRGEGKGIVKVWDLSSGATGKSALVHTIPHEKDHVSAIYVDGAMNELVTVAGNAQARVFDLRKLDEVVKSFSLLDKDGTIAAGRPGSSPALLFGGIEKLDREKYVSTMSMLQGRGPPGILGTGVAVWNVAGKVLERAVGVEGTALCVLSDSFDSHYVMPSEDAVSDDAKSRMRVLVEGKDEIVEFVVKSGSAEIRLPKAFVPNALDDAKELVLPDGPTVDPDLILELIFGTVTAIRTDQVYPLSCFFSLLGMKMHVVMTCKHAMSLGSIRDIMTILATSRKSGKSRPDSMTSALEHGCLNTLTDRLESITSNPELSELATRLDILEMIKAHVVSPVVEHKDIGFKKEDVMPAAWEELASRTFAATWESKKFPDVKLLTNDSAVIPAHLSILCCRTNWMAKILEFGGKEVDSLRQSGEVKVDLTFGALMALLRCVYAPKAVKSKNLSVLLAVLDHCTRYNELRMREHFIGKIQAISKGLGKGRDFSHAIAPVAHLLRNMEAFAEVQKYWIDAELIEVSALDALIADGERNLTLAASDSRLKAVEGEVVGMKVRLGRLEASMEKVLSQLQEITGQIASLKGT